MRRMFSIIATTVLVASCVTTGWDKTEKDSALNSCKMEISQFYMEPIPSLFCACMADKMEKEVPEFNQETAKQWLNGENGKRAGFECGLQLKKQLTEKQ